MRFLAVLELYKQGMVDILQFANFGELIVRRLPDGEIALDAVSLDDWDDDDSEDRAQSGGVSRSSRSPTTTTTSPKCARCSSNRARTRARTSPAGAGRPLA